MRTSRVILSVVLLATSGLPARAGRGAQGVRRRSSTASSVRSPAGASVARAACPATRSPTTPPPPSGGVWKSTDGGLTWKPIFDDQPTRSHRLASPSRRPTRTSSTSAPARRTSAATSRPGNGIYKSTDAGKTWKHVWKQDGQIGTMVVHPKNADIAFAAVLGHAFGPNPERGVYRTTDGGKTWEQVLFKDDDTGASRRVPRPEQPAHPLRRPLAGAAPAVGADQRRPRQRPVRLARRRRHLEAARATRTRRTKPNGLPEGLWGKVGVAVAPSNRQRVYALIEAEKGGLFRSDDGGETWDARQRRPRPPPAGLVLLARSPSIRRTPTSSACPQVPLLKSIDGGKTFKRVKGPHHGDHHDLWIDPKNPERMIDANDGGVDITTDGGETWYAPPLPICQFYHISVDNRDAVPRHGQHAGPRHRAAGRATACRAAASALGDWHTVGGGEAGYAVADPTDPNIVYAGEYGGYITRYDHRTGQARNISVYPFNPSGIDAGEA